MKKILFILCVMFISGICFAQNERRFDFETTDSMHSIYTPSGNAPRIVVQDTHYGDINSVKYSKDGRYLLSAGNDIKIWDVPSGKIVRTFSAVIGDSSQAEIYGGGTIVDLHPTGRYIIYVKPENVSKGSEKTEVSILSVETGKSIFDWWVTGKNGKHLNVAVQFSPDGESFAILTADEIYIYNFETKKLNSKLTSKKIVWSHDIMSRYLAFSGDGRYLCANVEDSETFHLCIAIWDIQKKKLVHQIPVGGAYPNFAVSTLGTYIACGDRDRTSIYNLENKNKVLDLDISPHLLHFTGDETKIVIFDDYYNHRVAVYDVNSGKNISSFKCERIECFALCPESDEFTFPEYYSSSKIYVKKLSDFSDVRQYPNIKFAVGGDFVINGDGQYFYDFSNHNTVSTSFIMKFNGDKITIPDNITAQWKTDDKVFFSYNNNLAYYDFRTKNVTVDTNIPYNIKSSLFSLCVSDDGKFICYKDDYGKITVYDVEKKQIRMSFYLENYDIKKIDKMQLSSTGKFLVLETEPRHIIFDTLKNDIVHKEYGYKKVWDNINEYQTYSGKIKFSKNDAYAFYVVPGGGKSKNRKDQNRYVLYKTNTWSEVRSGIVLSFLGGDDLIFSPDEEYYAKHIEFTDGTVGFELESVDQGKLIRQIKTNLPASYASVRMCITEDNQYLLIKANDSSTLRYSISSGKLLTTHIFASSGNYFTYTPEGYFTGSPGGINKFVHLVDGMQVFELGQLYDTLYRPDLVQAKLEGKDIGENPLKKIVATGDAPRVQFTQTLMATARNIKVEFSVQDTGGGIGYVYLSQNGKAMQVSSGEKSKAGQRFIYTCDVTLAKGENVFEAYAANSANKIESRHVSSTLTWQGKVEDSNLYVLAIGVDKYIKMPQNNLKYSVADATGIIESFKASPGGLYGSVNVMTLLDSDVSKDNIQKAFETFASKVKPDDMFVLHLAGHGVNYGGEYYYLPSDTLAKSDSDYPKVGVSKHFLTESLSEIQSLNTIILLDTCYSGAFIDAKAQGNELAQKTALEHLAHTSGQVILTASANSQTAAEGYKGHGIFTYAIMEAISGKANYNADSTLSIKEITQYVGYEVPNIYEKMGLARQSPWNSPLRGDFSVVATGNRQSPLFYEVSLDGGKRTDWVTVRTDDSDVGNFENALASAKKEAKKTSRSSRADQRSRGKGIYVGLGYGNTRFGSGFDISPEFYFLGWKHFYAGVGSDIIYKGAEKSESGKDIRKLDADIKFLLGYSYTFKRLRPYLCGGVGGYFSGDAKEKEIFVSSNSKTGVVTKTVYESDAKTGFVWEVAVGSDILLAEHFVIGTQYKLKNFVNCGFTDTWTVTIGWPF